ncbi:hypothetical protein L7F22_028003 [Adiantum nelumboides]|nr:hypothetical protein [Adiantum nelumboides]
MTLAMVLGAIHGAAAHVASTQGAWPKAKLAAVLTYLFVKELLGMALALPSLSRSLLLYSSLPSHPKAIQPLTPKKRLRLLRTHAQWVSSFNVSVDRNLPYGTAKRNLLDVYIPDAVASDRDYRRPAVMFVHGGAWATGSKELFSHLGACLAHSGVLTVLVQYSLFPEVLAWQQVREVSSALTWFLDNVEHYGGDPQKVTLMGHSAGAHLCALVIWERFKAAQQLQQRRVAAEAWNLTSELWPEICDEDMEEQDTRQPHNFIGLAGVFDIVEHLKFERKRGVDTMSSMTPAMGGKHLLEAMSPVHLFQSVRSIMSMVNSDRDQELMRANIDDAVLDNMNHLGAIDAGLCAASVTADNQEMCHVPCNNEDADSSVSSGGHCSASNIHLPGCTLMCSWSDMVVRPDSSISFHSVLQEDLGHKSQLIVFNDLAHSDFVNLDGRSLEQASLRRHILCILEP